MKSQVTSELRLLLQAIADRFIPRDEWPSATEERVIDYLELRAGEDPVSWTTLIVPGLQALDAESQSRYNHSYTSIKPNEQDQLLQDMELGNLEGWPISPRLCFETLLGLVMEGYYGNSSSDEPRQNIAWTMIGYHPGNVAGSDTSDPQLATKRFDQLRDHYDAIVIGAGAGGSTVAAGLAESGMQVLIVERGSWLRYSQISQDHMANHRFSKYGHNTGPIGEGYPRTILSADGSERITWSHEGDYHNNAMTVGGGTRVYGAQAWRFHPDDFRMASRYGIPDGSSLQDWPITYEELEPYYERAEWEIGVCGDCHAHPDLGWRRSGYPMPPLPMTLEAQRLAQAAAKLGWHAGPVPLLINSIEYDGRPACVRCGQCVGFACPTNSKNGGHNTMLVRALATGNCDLICDTMAERIDTENSRHATGVRLVMEVDGTITRRHIRAGHVIVAAGAIESARLLLHSATQTEPDGIGNRHDQVGRHLQGHVYAGAYATFDELVQDGQGPGVSIATIRFAHGNAGIIGGGLLANEFTRLPIVHWSRALAPDAARWGAAGKQNMRESYLRTSHVQGPIQEIPNPEARVRLSPTLKDRFGIPVAQLSGSVHPESIRASLMLAEQAETWLWAAGAKQVWRTQPGSGLSGGQHQAGTLRMGDDPETSVSDPLGRIHGYDNLWVSDGSVHVTNGGVNPVLTIFAMAMRVADHIRKGRQT